MDDSSVSQCPPPLSLRSLLASLSCVLPPGCLSPFGVYAAVEVREIMQFQCNPSVFLLWQTGLASA
eukprot:5689996-Prorocentrum_lima.AAC.1